MQLQIKNLIQGRGKGLCNKGWKIGWKVALLHRITLLELKQIQHKRLDVHIPLERLTKKEHELYFQLLMKLMRVGEMVDFSEDNVPVY